jgi:ferric-dicitrate binding protein FerR (iron transport regulator)
MNHYSSQKLEIRDPEIENQLLSGVFDPAGGAELARALESYGLIRIVEQNSSVIVLGAPQIHPEKK